MKLTLSERPRFSEGIHSAHPCASPYGQAARWQRARLCQSAVLQIGETLVHLVLRVPRFSEGIHSAHPCASSYGPAEADAPPCLSVFPGMGGTLPDGSPEHPLADGKGNDGNMDRIPRYRFFNPINGAYALPAGTIPHHFKIMFPKSMFVPWLAGYCPFQNADTGYPQRSPDIFLPASMPA